MTDFFKNLLSNGELQEENERLKEEINQLHNGRNPEELYTLFGKPIRYWEELKADNERLKEEVETRDNLVEHFRKEAINWAKISNDCIKDIENYKQTLQEIKGVVTALYMNNWLQMNETARKSIQLLQDLITKSEEE